MSAIPSRPLASRGPSVFAECALRALLRLCPLVLLLCVGGLLCFLFEQGWSTISPRLLFGDVPALDAILGRQAVWEGLWPACVGTACLVALSLVMALVPGIGCGLYLAEFAPPRQARSIRLAMDVLAGTPSIVMGLFGFTLILSLRNTILPSANTSLLLAAACLALLVMPVLVATTAEALKAVPPELRATATALGFTRRQCARHILMPAAASGIGSGVILSLARAAEDTAVIMLTGVVANAGLPAGLWSKFEALPFSIYYTAAQYQDQAELLRGFGAALLLLALSSGLLLGARFLERRFHRRWQGEV